MSQTSLWQNDPQNTAIAELSSALYEREIQLLSTATFNAVMPIQAKLKSLPYYVQRAAYKLIHAHSPLDFDIQNASWSAKQSSKLPLVGQDVDLISQWYTPESLTLGLVIPILENTQTKQRIHLDSIDRIDAQNNRIHSNYYGWFDVRTTLARESSTIQLMKPSKRIMSAACCGHQWGDNGRQLVSPLSLRELLLTTNINWRNFKKLI